MVDQSLSFSVSWAMDKQVFWGKRAGLVDHFVDRLLKSPLSEVEHVAW
jgi:uncharacterized protein YggL (DUF469 family)